MGRFTDKKGRKMKRLFKYFTPRYWKLRRILSDIKEVKKLIINGRHDFLCFAFAEVNNRYRTGSHVTKYIPEFNPIFLTGKDYFYGLPWWPIEDRTARLEALDKLIAIYEQKIKDF
jgi:hypothetical protein